jgi:hypothetical protein
MQNNKKRKITNRKSVEKYQNKNKMLNKQNPIQIFVKKCLGCNEEKISTEFAKDSRNKDGYNYRCKLCNNYYKQKLYRLDPNNKKKNNIRNTKKRIINRLYVYNILCNSKCIDCGDTRWQVLDFDHVRGEKLGNISIMVHDNSIKRIQEEIDKCDIRCANCHRIKTSEQLNYYPYLKNK